MKKMLTLFFALTTISCAINAGKNNPNKREKTNHKKHEVSPRQAQETNTMPLSAVQISALKKVLRKKPRIVPHQGQTFYVSLKKEKIVVRKANFIAEKEEQPTDGSFIHREAKRKKAVELNNVNTSRNNLQFDDGNEDTDEEEEDTTQWADKRTPAKKNLN